MHVVEQHVFKRYIRTTGASIKNRGMHDLKEYIQKDMELDPQGMRYCYKFDIRKFYESVSQDFMMYALRRMFKDKTLLTMFDNFVHMMPNGLSIGLRSSQAFGNMLLSMFLDHYLKDQYGASTSTAIVMMVWRVQEASGNFGLSVTSFTKEPK